MQRSFPKDLRITQEAFSIIAFGMFWSWFYEVILRITTSSEINEKHSDCFVFSLRTDFIIDMLRSTFFSLILSYYTRYKKSSSVRNERMNNIYDFSKDVECQLYFRLYLKRYDQELYDEYIKSLERLMEVDDEDIDQVFSERISSRFEEYKRTRSYKTLNSLRVESDRILDYGYDRII